MANIVICDDEKDILNVMSEFFKAAGHMVQVTAEPKDVLGLIDAKPCDLLVVDYTMGELNGKGVLELVRKKYSPIEVPVAFLTGLKDRTLVEDLAKRGISGFFIKPPDFKTLGAKVKDITAKRLELSDVRSLILKCNIPDPDLYKDPGLGTYKEKNIPLFKILHPNSKGLIVALLDKRPVKSLATLEGLELLSKVRVLSQFGSGWFRQWPTTWTLNAAKKGEAPVAPVISKNELANILSVVSVTLEES